MKRMILVAFLACGMLALMAGAAFAVGSGTGSYTGTALSGMTWSELAVGDGTAYLDGSGNPHGGFDVGTHNCQVCHSVHHAAEGGEALLPDVVANACVYCHITSDTGYIAIYDGDVTNYTDASDFGHDSAGGAFCTSCHQVHAATSMMVNAAAYGADEPYLVEKLLKVDGTGNDLIDSTGTVIVFDGTEASETAVSMWCTSCHVGGVAGSPLGYYNAGYNTISHVMTDPTNAYTSSSGLIGTIAESTSVYCSSCHQRGEINKTPALPGAAVSSQYNFPHWSDGVRMLTAATSLDSTGQPDAAGAATDSHADGVCINCHRGASVTGGGVGVGW